MTDVDGTAEMNLEGRSLPPLARSVSVRISENALVTLDGLCADFGYSRNQIASALVEHGIRALEDVRTNAGGGNEGTLALMEHLRVLVRQMRHARRS